MPHLLLLLVVVVVGRLVRRCCGQVVRSIALVVHHIQATHSDRGAGRRWRSEEERRAHSHTHTHTDRYARLCSGTARLWHFRRAVSSAPPLPPYKPRRAQWPCRPTMRVQLCAPQQHHPGPHRGSKRRHREREGETNTLYPKEEGKKKEKTKLLSDKFSERFWLGESSSLCFGGELYLEKGLGPFTHAHPGEGPAWREHAWRGVHPGDCGAIPPGGAHSWNLYNSESC